MTSLRANRFDRSAASLPLSAASRFCWAVALAVPLVLGPVWCFAWRPAGHWLGTISGLVLLALLGVCTATDLRNCRIYNWATYSAFFWALAINIAASSPSSVEGSLNHPLHWVTANGPGLLGGVGLGQCVTGAVVCFLTTMFGYHLSGRGAGDVKLATAIGALVGPHPGLFAVAYTYIVAAVAIIIWSTWANGPLAIAKAAARSVGCLLGPLWPFPPSASDSALLLRPIPLGPYFAIGTLLVVLEVVPS